MGKKADWTDVQQTVTDEGMEAVCFRGLFTNIKRFSGRKNCGQEMFTKQKEFTNLGEDCEPKRRLEFGGH